MFSQERRTNHTGLIIYANDSFRSQIIEKINNIT